MIRKSVRVFVEGVGGENKTSTRRQKIPLALAEWGTKQRGVSGTQARWLDMGGPQTTVSVPRHRPASFPQHTFRRSSGFPGSTGTAVCMACTQEQWCHVQRWPPFNSSRQCPRMMERSILIHYTVLDPRYPISFLSLPLFPFLWPTSFFLAPSFQEQERPLSSLFGPGERPGTASAHHCPPSFHKWHQKRILSCLWTSERKKSLPIWSECQVITFNTKQKHKSQGKYIPDCYNLMNTRIESTRRGLFFHSQWVRFCYIERALRIAFKEGDTRGKGNTSMLSVVREHSFDHSILWSVQRDCWII